MLAQILRSNLGAIANVDALTLGVSVAASLFFGFIVFMNDRKSVTNRSFLLFLLLTVAYSAVNFLQYHLPAERGLLVLRLVIFFGVWHAFSLFQLFYVFPRSQKAFPKWYWRGAVPLAAVTSFLALTPLVIQQIGQLSATGQVVKVVNGPGFFLFAFTVVVLISGALWFLAKNILQSRGIERTQTLYVACGTVMSFSLLLMFNFILPGFLDNARFVPLAPLFFLPFIAFTFYATVKHHFLNTKVISTEIFTFLLAVVTLLEVILTDDLLILIFRMGVFVLVLAFGMLLMRSVRREVEQRVELERLTMHLKEANLRLEDLSRFKSQLLSLASHQIKSPLAAIKGFASILLEGLYGPVEGKVRETLEKMKKSADGLVVLINTLLDLRKVEEGRMEYQFAKIDLVALAGQVMEELEPLATEKRLEFTFHSSNPQVFVSADESKLKQVLQNLVDNSVKYTARGFVRVTITEEGQSAMFRVTDSGLGIPPDLIPHLFEEFIRDERAREEVIGTGLGLYIARKIVEAHGGRIWAESKGPNQGASFYVALRRAA